MSTTPDNLTSTEEQRRRLRYRALYLTDPAAPAPADPAVRDVLQKAANRTSFNYRLPPEEDEQASTKD